MIVNVNMLNKFSKQTYLFVNLFVYNDLNRTFFKRSATKFVGICALSYDLYAYWGWNKDDVVYVVVINVRCRTGELAGLQQKALALATQHFSNTPLSQYPQQHTNEATH